jgi:hypothetical protein
MNSTYWIREGLKSPRISVRPPAPTPTKKENNVTSNSKAATHMWN